MTGGTALQSPYTFSYMRRGKAAKTEATAAGGAESATPGGAPSTEPNPYENSIKTISTVSTVEEFWETYDFLNRPNELPTTTDYHFFRDGIKPTWEDPGNAKGGKWIIRLPKGLASRYWEEIILALIGCQFMGVPVQELCGAVLSVRYSEDILGVWNRTASDRDKVERIRDSIKKILQLPTNAYMEYKPHQASLQDRSSFRNTQVWKPKSATAGSGAAAANSSQGAQPSSEGPRRQGSWTERDSKTSSSGGAKREVRGSWRTAG
jgi:translation initiation factor 4E